MGSKLPLVFSQVNKYTLSYRFLYGNVQGCVFAKNRPVSLNWTDYTPIVGFGNCSMFCCALLCLQSTFAIILQGAGCFALVVFLVSRDCCPMGGGGGGYSDIFIYT